MVVRGSSCLIQLRGATSRTTSTHNSTNCVVCGYGKLVDSGEEHGAILFDMRFRPKIVVMETLSETASGT